MLRTVWLSCLAVTLALPGALYASPHGDVKKGNDEKKTQSDSTQARKPKGSQDSDDVDQSKKKLKPRAVPNTPAPNARQPQHEESDDEPMWDTDFLVRNVFPIKQGPRVILASY